MTLDGWTERDDWENYFHDDFRDRKRGEINDLESPQLRNSKGSIELTAAFPGSTMCRGFKFHGFPHESRP